MLQIIRVFPHIQREQGAQPRCQRGVLVGGRDDFQPPGGIRQPRIARPEYRQRGFFKKLFKALHAAEPRADLRFQAASLPRVRRRHPLKKEPVIIHPARIAAHRYTQTLRQVFCADDQLFQRKLLQPRLICKHGVQIVDIGFEMPVMVQAHGFFVQKRFQRVGRIRQRQIDKRVALIFHAHSKYSQGLRMPEMKAKGKAAANLGEMIEIARNEQWTSNRKAKHRKDAKYGWYKYDTSFAIPVKDSQGGITNYKSYSASLIVRHDADGKLYLYDVMGIKQNKTSLSSSKFSYEPGYKLEQGLVYDETVQHEDNNVKKSLLENGEDDIISEKGGVKIDAERVSEVDRRGKSKTDDDSRGSSGGIDTYPGIYRGRAGVQADTGEVSRNKTFRARTAEGNEVEFSYT